MFGLTTATDISFLSGVKLEQVCVGLCQVILNFSSEVSISIEGEYEVDGNVADLMGLVRLLGKRLTHPINRGEGILELAFSNGIVLIIRDSNPNGESYQVTARDRQIIV